MKQNLVVLLADLFNLFEIHPAQCVDYPEADVASGKFRIILCLLSYEKKKKTLILVQVQNFSLAFIIVVLQKMLYFPRENSI
jgi:hypothetical protein